MLLQGFVWHGHCRQGPRNNFGVRWSTPSAGVSRKPCVRVPKRSPTKAYYVIDQSAGALETRDSLSFGNAGEMYITNSSENQVQGSVDDLRLNSFALPWDWRPTQATRAQ